jgi:ribose/xylose/arabinose/galactoside ABC-type transport system permease subunit
MSGAGGRSGTAGIALAARLVPVVLVVALLALMWVEAPNFFRVRNLTNILVQSSMLGVMAIGMTVVMVGGGIDLSLPATMAFSAVVGALLAAQGVPLPLAGLAMLATGGLIGAFNGFAVAVLGMIPFVVTLAMMIVMGGAAIWATNAVSVPLPEPWIDAVLVRVLGLPLPAWIMLGLTALATTAMRRTVPGQWLYAVGTNPAAARIAGVPTRAVLFGTYVTAGLCAGITAILLSARLGAASAPMGNDAVVLDVVSAVVVGGVSIYGGLGSPLGAVLGTVLITVIGNALNMLGVSFYVTLIIKGAAILAFVALDGALRRRAQ